MRQWMPLGMGLAALELADVVMVLLNHIRVMCGNLHNVTLSKSEMSELIDYIQAWRDSE